MSERLEFLHEAHKKAAMALTNRICKEFPLKTRVTVKRGRGFIEAFVWFHPSWWADPGRIGLQHARTGWIFRADYHDCERQP